MPFPTDPHPFVCLARELVEASAEIDDAAFVLSDDGQVWLQEIHRRARGFVAYGKYISRLVRSGELPPGGPLPDVGALQHRLLCERGLLEGAPEDEGRLLLLVLLTQADCQFLPRATYEALTSDEVVRTSLARSAEVHAVEPIYGCLRWNQELEWMR
jgi:hypothetical protein